ncbi:enolase C-terminal domain-like protein [Terasakiella sp. A23]|uniref:enolase C-terminal domain-like protein n=1 Tax=Terasakiella sp. FCG-A23 TaxID=3080561 RepID=UPI002954C063|nr:enolase C-terminal domain-like protein [Terasakiella sp. A23]MDV7338994.1 enolase C-terminal domain-like protein [Terasakiella sp. A23]
MKIKSLNARPVLAPMKRPIRTAVGEIPKAPLVLIDVLSDQNIKGSAYIFAYTPLTLTPLVAFINNLNELICAWDYAPAETFEKLRQTFRLLGSQGLVGMALSGVEMALWDGLGKSMDQSVVNLLGGVEKDIAAYDSYGIVNLALDGKEIEASIDAGFKGVKIKIGAADLQRDIQAVSTVRQIIGDDVSLMVDYNQSLDAAEAIHRLQYLKDFNIAWVEEPVHAEDLIGHARVSDKSGVPVQTGENWWFIEDMQDAIRTKACDFAMLDLMKIGGISGWMKAASLAKTASLPVSSHLFVEASAHCLALTPTCHWLEWLDIASSILQSPQQVVDGYVKPGSPGLGINWNETAINKYLI